MNVRIGARGRTAAAALLSAAVTMATMGTAAAAYAETSAGDGYRMRVTASAVCDTGTGEWVVRWDIANDSDVHTTLGHVLVFPAGSVLEGYPVRVPAHGSVTGTQRLPPGVASGSIQFDATFDDLVVTRTGWPVYAFAGCSAPAP